jgi:hypothetical protein
MRTWGTRPISSNVVGVPDQVRQTFAPWKQTCAFRCQTDVSDLDSYWLATSES